MIPPSFPIFQQASPSRSPPSRGCSPSVLSVFQGRAHYGGLGQGKAPGKYLDYMKDYSSQLHNFIHLRLCLKLFIIHTHMSQAKKLWYSLPSGPGEILLKIPVFACLALGQFWAKLINFQLLQYTIIAHNLQTQNKRSRPTQPSPRLYTMPQRAHSQS